jgi:hypothetical protein
MSLQVLFGRNQFLLLYFVYLDEQFKQVFVQTFSLCQPVENRQPYLEVHVDRLRIVLKKSRDTMEQGLPTGS